MSVTIKQSVGIDCGSQELVVSFTQLAGTGDLACRGTRSFNNSEAGFSKLVKWISNLADPSVKCRYIIEATGVYHEKLSYFLVNNNEEVCIVLPNKIHAYAKSCTSKQQDDYQASKVLAEFGCVKKVDAWQPPQPVFRMLKQLSRERGQLQQEQSIISCQLHAEKRQAYPCTSSIKRMEHRLKLITKQIEQIEKETADIIQENKELKVKIKTVSTIPGIGEQTVITVIAETNGFNLIRNRKQLASYAGYDVVQKKSGTSVRGKARISKKGNSRLRKALHFPAITAAKYNRSSEQLHTRLVQKHGVKMKGYVAVQRKLLLLIYTLWQKNEPYKLLEQPVEAALTELD